MSWNRLVQGLLYESIVHRFGLKDLAAYLLLEAERVEDPADKLNAFARAGLTGADAA